MQTIELNPTFSLPPQAASFQKRVNNSFLFNLYLWSKLPAAFWSGVRVREFDQNGSVVSVPFKRLTQNPFRSTYFASLSMAAEMSTGLTAMMAMNGAKPSVSMLVTKIEGEFFKKATSRTYFTFDNAKKIYDAVAQTQATGEPVEVTVTSVGKNKEGEAIATFHVTWSFKRRSK